MGLGIIQGEPFLINKFYFIMKNFSEFQSAEDAAEFGEDYDPPYPVVNIMIEVFDKIAVGFFTIEYIIRFVCCPRKFKFFFRF